MAGSFANDQAASPVLRGDVRSAAAPATQLEGGGAGRAPSTGGVQVAPTDYSGIEQTSMRAFDAINKLAGGLLNSYVEKVEKQQYYDGMAQVAQGRALADIQAEEPWYTKIIGPSATVRGAQAMTVTTALQQAETEFMQRMPELRSQSPDAVRAELVAMGTRIGGTGDPLVDSIAQSKLAEGWGGMLKTHMREHLAWQQEDMLQKQQNQNITIAQSMTAARKAAARTGWDPADKAAAEANAVASFMPLPGQSKEVWNSGAQATLMSAMEGGNFDYVNAIRKDPEAWGALDIRVRANIEANYHGYVMKDAARNPNLGNFTTSLESLEFGLGHGATGVTTPAELDGVLDRMNAAHADQTGSSAPFIDTKMRANYHGLWAKGRAAREDREARVAAAAAKSAMDEAEKRQHLIDSKNLTLEAFANGDPNMLKGLPIDARSGRLAMNELFDSEVGAGGERADVWFKKAAAVSSNSAMRSDKLEHALQVGVDGILAGAGPLTAAQVHVYTLAQKLYQQGGYPEALGNYLGSQEKAAKLAVMFDSGVDVNDPKAFIDMRQRIQQPAAKLDKVGREAVTAYLKSEDPGIIKRQIPFIGGPRTLTNYELSPEGMSALSDAVADRVARLAQVHQAPIKQLAQMAMAEVLPQADFIGGALALPRQNMPGDTSLHAAVNRIAPGRGNQGSELYQTSLTALMHDKLRQAAVDAGAKAEDVAPDSYRPTGARHMGNGVLMVSLLPKDPDKPPFLKNVVIYPQELADRITAADLARGKRANAVLVPPGTVKHVDTGFGPTLVPPLKR